MAKLRSWKDNARERATNPEYPAELLKGIQNELDNRANPDRAYIKSKIKSLEDFIDNDANFVSDQQLYGKRYANIVAGRRHRRKMKQVI